MAGRVRNPGVVAFMLMVALAAVTMTSATSLTNSIPGVKTTYDMLKPGASDAEVVEKGATVTVHATGIVKQTNKKFWSTKDAGQQPFECVPRYKAGVGGVIKGWDQGCLGMKLGEIRRLHIPADEGYGASGFPAWGIPPGGDLLFEIEILKIKGTKQNKTTKTDDL